jgi:ATP-binding cassette subfamily C protein LapB
MDAELEASVMQNMLSSLPASTTVVLVTHKASLLRLVDRVIVMDQGRVLMDGARSEILAKLTTPVPTPQSHESPDDVVTEHGNNQMQASS